MMVVIHDAPSTVAETAVVETARLVMMTVGCSVVMGMGDCETNTLTPQFQVN